MTQTPDYAGKKILFTAFSVSEGSEALAGYEFVKRHGATDISTLYWGDNDYAAKIPADINAVRVDGNNNFDPQITAGYDLVFRHQTTRPDMLRSPSTTNTNEFFKFCPAKIIGITGTKGKGTTATMLSEMFDAAGVANRLLGNMGNTAIEQLDSITPEELVIFEISSFQLWDLEYSPHVAVVLMMDVDHQDIHLDVEDYIQAKAQIVRHQTEDDIVIYHPTNEMTARVVGGAASKHIRYMTDEGALVEDGHIRIAGKVILPVEDVALIGEHNLENVCAAVTIAWQYTQDVAALSGVASSFGGLEHRLEDCGEYERVRFINDSFSVVPIATNAAIHSFESPITLIAGGFDRGADFTELAHAINTSTVDSVIAIGQTGSRLAKTLREEGFNYVVDSHAETMEQIVKQAIEHVKPGGVVLLSPGCPSFDMFANYKDRGQQFKAVVQSL